MNVEYFILEISVASIFLSAASVICSGIFRNFLPHCGDPILGLAIVHNPDS
jgi:hypothetical protein